MTEFVLAPTSFALKPSTKPSPELPVILPVIVPSTLRVESMLNTLKPPVSPGALPLSSIMLPLRVEANLPLDSVPVNEVAHLCLSLLLLQPVAPIQILSVPDVMAPVETFSVRLLLTSLTGVEPVLSSAMKVPVLLYSMLPTSLFIVSVSVVGADTMMKVDSSPDKSPATFCQ